MSLGSQTGSARITRCLNFCPEHVTKLCIWDCLPSHGFLMWGSEESRVNEVQEWGFSWSASLETKLDFFLRDYFLNFPFSFKKHKFLEDKHPIDFAGLLKFATHVGLAHCRCGGVGLQITVGKEEPIRNWAEDAGIWECSSVCDFLVVLVVVVLTWLFHWVLRTKLTSLTDLSQ